MEKGFNLKILPNPVGNIAYIDKASNSQRLLIILHPYGKDSRFALENFSFLHGDFHLILPDLPFHGKTSLIKEEFNSKDLAAIIDQLAQLYSSKEIYILGHSLGARIASLASPYLRIKIKQTLFYGPEGIATPFTSFFFRPVIYRTLRPLRYLFLNTTLIESLGQLLYELKMLNKIAYRFLQLHSNRDKKQNLISLWKSLSKSDREMKEIIKRDKPLLGHFNILIGYQDKTTPYKSIKGSKWEKYSLQVEGGHFFFKQKTKEKIRKLLLTESVV